MRAQELLIKDVHPAMGPEGALRFAWAYAGKKGFFRYSPSSRPVIHHVAGPMIVGPAMDAMDVFPAETGSIFHIGMGGLSEISS
jgi:hypothetical protein